MTTVNQNTQGFHACNWKNHIFALLSPGRNNVAHITVSELVRRNADVCSWFKTTISNTIIMWTLASACICAKQNIWTLYIHLEIKLDFNKSSIIHKNSVAVPSHNVQISFAVNDISVYLNSFKGEHTGYTACFAFNVLLLKVGSNAAGDIKPSANTLSNIFSCLHFNKCRPRVMSS